MVHPLNSLVDTVLNAQAGNREAFLSLMREMELPLYRTARSMVKHEEDCADALQETILHAFKSLHTLKEPAFFKTWMFRILINECNRILKRRSRTLSYGEFPNVPALSNEFEKVDLLDAVDRLDDNQRLVIVLHYFQDMPLSQVSEVLDISPEAVKTRLHRARKKLQDIFRPNCEMELIRVEPLSRP